MAEWYCSSTAYSAVSAWAASTAYTVGQLVKPTAPTLAQRSVFRCTTAGTSGASEPSWNYANNGTTVSGGTTFTNVRGQSAYGWSAAAGSLAALLASGLGPPVVGDRIFVSSDHSETATSSTSWGFNGGTAAYGLIQLISVNKAGSVPPVAADMLSGATIATSAGNLTVDAYCNVYWQGFVIAAFGNCLFNASGNKSHYYRNCSISITGAGSTSKLASSALTARITFDNTTVQFSHAGQGICPHTSGVSLELHWINTPAGIAGSTFPTTLFSTASGGSSQIVCRGVDLSAITGTLMSSPAAAQGTKLYLDSCKIHPSVTRYGTPAAGAVANDEVELVNCYDGTNVLNERYGAPGTVTTDRSTYMTDGAEDGIGAYSLKLVSSSRADKQTVPLDSFWCDVGNTATGSSKTATVEIVSSASLNDDDISLLLEYLGTASSSVASFTSTLPATPLTTASALPTSLVTWNNPPGTPVKQSLQATFTPQAAGRIRGLVKLGKTSTTCWINPQVTVT